MKGHMKLGEFCYLVVIAGGVVRVRRGVRAGGGGRCRRGTHHAAAAALLAASHSAAQWETHFKNTTSIC